MDSGSKNDDDGDAATKYVLDYYKKYSQNKELPKYFTGTSMSYLPRIDDENIENIMPTIDIDKDTCEVRQSLNTSGASSVMSNRKLEWDNGADIGYENLQDIKVLRRSISLPVITDIRQSDPDFDMQHMGSRLDRARSEGSSDSNVKVILVTFASSSESRTPDIDNLYSSSSSHPEGKKYIPSYSSNTDSNGLSKNSAVNSLTSEGSSNDKIANFASSLSYLKQKIGLPGAHSTPKNLETRKSDPELFSGTPVTHKLEKSDKISKSDEDINQIYLKPTDKGDNISKLLVSNVEMLPVTEHNDGICKKRRKYNGPSGRIFKYKNSKTINLALTKPITVECVCSPKPETKPLPVTVKKLSSIGIQTDAISEKELVEILHKSTIDNQNQSLLYFEYSDSDRTGDKTHCGTQTNSDVTSPCDSFEYYKNSAQEVKTSSSDKKNDKYALKPTNKIVLPSRQELKNQGRVDSENENSHQSSSNICLGEIISTNQLDNIGDSVEKSIHLLHKLLKSKKYDPITKKRYIKKLMQRITESKYLTESSASSELFCPKKSNIQDLQPPAPISTDTSDEKRKEGVLQVNVPLYLALTDKTKISPRKKRLGIKTFVQDFLPQQNPSSPEETSSPPEIIPVDLRDTKNRFTLTNKDFRGKREHPNQETNKTLENQTNKTPHQPDPSIEKQYESSTSKSVEYQNWREDKTVSEKLLEEKSGTIYGEGDCLVKFAEKEREYQINWINNEISHLGKLKGLLEKPAEPPKLTEPLENIKKTTTVYTVFEEHNQSASKGVKFKRNYVIETHLGTDSHIPVRFNLKGRKYTVDRKCENTTSRGIVGDIEVVSSDSVTNIKVSTFCESCKRSPCTCGCSKCKKRPCICNTLKSTKAVCRACHRIPCTCQNTTSKPHSHCPLDENHCWRCNKSPCQCPEQCPSPSMASSVSGKTICLICHRNPCVCVKKSSGKGVLSKTCLSCGKYPCIYGKSKTSTISDEYTGAFIVACPPLSVIESAIKKKASTFPRSSKDERNFCAKCANCKRYPCICNVLEEELDTISVLSYTKMEETCSICGKCPCVCATRTGSKALQICTLCAKYPCICETLNTKCKIEKRCSVCGKRPCICVTIKRQYLGRSSNTRIQETCSICGKYPCICITRTGSKALQACQICGKCPCICVKQVGRKALQACTICNKYPCICNEHGSSVELLEVCSSCGKYPCVCEMDTREYLGRGSNRMKEICSICSKYPCVCATQTSSRASRVCAICGKCPCICKKHSSSIHLAQRCSSCGKCPCVCATLKTNAKLDKKCSVCGRRPCICETIRRDYLNRSTSISAKSLDKCRTCGKYPCICDLLKDSHSRGTSVSRKSLVVCSICGKCPCICNLLKDSHSRGTSISRKSLEVCSVCGKCPCVCKTTSKTALKNTESRTGSLKRMFENCNCSTQTNCTCDFVEKLIERFNQVDGSTLLKTCKCNSLQTDDQNLCDCQHVGVQTESDRKHQILQTAMSILGEFDSKISQTDRCCQNIGIQTMEIDVCKQIEISCSEEKNKKTRSSSKLKSKKSLCQCDGKVDVGCACEMTHGTQTLGNKRVVLTCSSQSDDSRTVSPTGRLRDHAHCTGVSHLRKYRKAYCAANKHCFCGGCKVRPQTAMISEESDSKTESDTRCITSSKSSSVMTSCYNGTVESQSEPCSSKTGSLVTCICCKEKYPCDKISILGSANQNFPLCTRCLQRRPILTSLCYAGPEHICNCYKSVRNDVLQDIKTTVKDLYDLEYCTCTTPSRSKNSEYCTHCQMKLKKTAKTRNGIAYTLTLEDKSPAKVKCKRKKKTPSLEEIRIRVPCPYAKKEHKDKVNLCRQDGDKGGVAVGYMERIRTDNDNRKCPRVKLVCGKTKRSRRSNLTLQDYLKKNKPDFIDAAEHRRQTLFTSRSQRELIKDEAKIRFFEDNKCQCSKLKKENTKMFTEQEMKAITRRNYAKLPEVKQKNIEQKERRLRNADKLIVDVFSTKIRNCALKGKRDFPLSQNIVSLPKA